MKKVLVQKTDNKFVNNISHVNNVDLNVVDISNRLYEIFYFFKPDAAIFMASKINTTETNQFIEEFQNTIKCFIYHDEENLNKRLLKSYNNTYHLIEDKKNKKIKENPEYKIIKVPKLLNKDIYNKNNSENKNEDIVCFLDNVDRLPENIAKILYPSSLLKIKLFNNTSIKHHQNLGILTELDRAEVLKKSQYFLSIEDHYRNEALACGCAIVSPEDLINNNLTKSYDFNESHIETYTNFIEKILNEN